MKRKDFIKGLGFLSGGVLLSKVTRPLKVEASVKDNTPSIDCYSKEEIDALLEAFAKKSEVPTKVSQLTNDSGFLKSHQNLSAYLQKGKLVKTEGIIRVNGNGGWQSTTINYGCTYATPPIFIFTQYWVAQSNENYATGTVRSNSADVAYFTPTNGFPYQFHWQALGYVN